MSEAPPTGGRVPDADRLAIGTAQWRMPYGVANRHGQPSRAEIGAIADAAWSAGIRILDTARVYGTAEDEIGALPRGWRVATKLAPDVAGPEIDPHEARRRAEASLAASRQALGTDLLDTVLLHRATHLDESGGAAWSVLEEEHAAGRIGSIGASVTAVREAGGLLERPGVAVIQVPASLLDQRLARAGFFDAAAAAGREILVRSVFLQGVAHLPAAGLPAHLSGLTDALRGLDRLASEVGAPRAALFLAWARHRLEGAVVIVGGETAEQLRANLAAWGDPDAGEAARQVEAEIPDLPDSILDPWRWPRIDG